MTIEIGTLIAVAGLLLSFLTYQFNKQKEDKNDTKNDTQQYAQIKAQMDYISKGVDDIRIDQKASGKLLSEHGERITRLEESTKQAHKRIDNFERSLTNEV